MLCKLLLAVVLVSIGSVRSDNTCRACNCQFNNVQVLTGLIESIVNNTLFSGLLDNAVSSTLYRQQGKLLHVTCTLPIL